MLLNCTFHFTLIPELRSTLERRRGHYQQRRIKEVMTSEKADQTKAFQTEYLFFESIATLSEDARKTVLQEVRAKLPKLPDSFPLFFFRGLRRGAEETRWCEIAYFRGNAIPALSDIEILESRVKDGIRSIRVSQAHARG